MQTWLAADVAAAAAAADVAAAVAAAVEMEQLETASCRRKA